MTFFHFFYFMHDFSIITFYFFDFIPQNTAFIMMHTTIFHSNPKISIFIHDSSIDKPKTHCYNLLKYSHSRSFFKKPVRMGCTTKGEHYYGNSKSSGTGIDELHIRPQNHKHALSSSAGANDD